MKKLTVTIALLVFFAGALAQQPVVQVDITADQLLSGEADTRLQELGARAASETLVVNVTAPGYWHELIQEQIEAGATDADLAIAFRETIIESVIVRLHEPEGAPALATEQSEQPPEPVAENGPVGPAPEAPPAEERDEPDREAALQEEARNNVVAQSPEPIERPAVVFEPEVRPVMQAPTESSAEETPEEPAPAAKEPEPATEVETPTVAEASDEPETPVRSPGGDEALYADMATGATEKAAPETELAASDAPPSEPEEPARDEAADRESLERRLNSGQSIDKSLSAEQLRRGDQLFKTGGLIAVVRPSRVGRNVYWLETGFDLDLDNNEDLRRERVGKYEVLRRLDVPEVEEPEEEETEDPEVARALGLESDEVLDERTEMEARYNQGRPVDSTVSIAGLRPDDLLYVGDELIMVVRRTKVALKRFWLEEELDLAREELEQVGTRKYRVQRVIR